MPVVWVGMEGNHIVVAVDGEVRLPVQCNHDQDNMMMMMLIMMMMIMTP